MIEDLPAPVIAPTPEWLLEERKRPGSLFAPPVVRVYPWVQLPEPEPRAMAPRAGYPYPTSFIQEEEA